MKTVARFAFLFLTTGLDFEETYAPAPEHFSNLFLQAYALTQGWKRDGFDISTAYLQSDVKHNECGTIAWVVVEIVTLELVAAMRHSVEV